MRAREAGRRGERERGGERDRGKRRREFYMFSVLFTRKESQAVVINMERNKMRWGKKRGREKKEIAEINVCNVSSVSKSNNYLCITHTHTHPHTQQPLRLVHHNAAMWFVICVCVCVVSEALILTFASSAMYMP